jgi:hypothetical protein
MMDCHGLWPRNDDFYRHRERSEAIHRSRIATAFGLAMTI